MNDLRTSRPTTPTSAQASKSLLDKIDAIAKTVNSTNSHVTSIDSRVTSIDNRMAEIDKKLGDMADRLLVAENDIQEAKDDVAAVTTELATAKAETLRRFEVLEQQQDSLQQRLVQIEDTSSSVGPGSAADAERMQVLETANAKLANTVQKLEVEHALLAHASDIVIGGLPLSENCDYKLAAFAVIKTIVPDFTLSEIQAVRCFTAKKVDIPASAAPITSQVSGSSLEDDAPDMHVPVAANQPSGASSKSTSKGSFSALIVTLNNATTAKNIRYAKIVWKKLTTSQLQPDLVADAGLVLPQTPSTININEYLPKEQYKLKSLVYKKSRDKRLNFVTYMRDGLIYARRKNETVSALINTPEDLNNF